MSDRILKVNCPDCVSDNTFMARADAVYRIPDGYVKRQIWECGSCGSRFDLSLRIVRRVPRSCVGCLHNYTYSLYDCGQDLTLSDCRIAEELGKRPKDTDGVCRFFKDRDEARRDS